MSLSSATGHHRHSKDGLYEDAEPGLDHRRASAASSSHRRRSSALVPEQHNADADVLAQLGYKQELRRNFSLWEVFGIAFAIMGLLPSIASTLAYSLPAGPVGLVWGWFVASAFILVVGLAMADLGSSLPTTGGLYWWTHYFASERWRNPLSFLVGYSNTLGLIAGLCSIDYGFALELISVVQMAHPDYTASAGVVYAVFLVCVISHGVVCSLASQSMARLQLIFVAANMLLILGTVIALPVGRAKKGLPRSDGKYIFGRMENLTAWPAGWTFFLSWLSPIWTIGSFDSCVHMSEEAANAVTAVPYGIIMSIACCWFFGWICVIAIAACMDHDLKRILESPFGQPMAQIYYDAIGKQGAMTMMTLLFIVQWLMGISILVAASRQSWAFSRDGALPFSRFFKEISARFGYIPLRTTWGCVLCAAVLGLLSLINAAAAQALFALAVTGNNMAWGMPIFCRIFWGEHKFKPGPFYTGTRFSKPISVLAIIFLIFGTVLVCFPESGPKVDAHSMNYTVVVTAAVWIGALGYYYIDAYKWFEGPKVTLEDGTEVRVGDVADGGTVGDGAVDGQDRKVGEML